MTIKEFYEWAVQNGVEDFKLKCETEVFDIEADEYSIIDEKKKEVWMWRN